MSKRVDLQMQLPLSFYRLTNDVIQHGVIHMLVPPIDLIREWIDKENVQDDEKERYLSYMASLIPPSIEELLEKLESDDDDDSNDVDDDDDRNDEDSNDDVDIDVDGVDGVDGKDYEISEKATSKSDTLLLPTDEKDCETYEKEVHPIISQFSSMVSQKVLYTIF